METTKESICYYVKIGPYFNFMVPRLNGKGFVKKPFGGGTINQSYKRWRQPVFARVALEGDGFIRLQLTSNDANILSRVFDEIRHAFPRISKFEKLTEAEFKN